MTHTSPVWLLVSKANKHTHTLSISLSNTHAGTNTAHTQLCWTSAWRQAFRFYHSNRTTRIAAQNLSDRDLEQETDSALCNLFKLCNWFIFASTPFPPPPLLSCSLTQILPFVFIAVSPPTSSSGVWIGYPWTECINIKILHILSFVFFYWMFFNMLTLMKSRWLLVCKCCNKLTVSLWVCQMVISLWYISNLWVATN